MYEPLPFVVQSDLTVGVTHYEPQIQQLEKVLLRLLSLLISTGMDTL